MAFKSCSYYFWGAILGTSQEMWKPQQTNAAGEVAMQYISLAKIQILSDFYTFFTIISWNARSKDTFDQAFVRYFQKINIELAQIQLQDPNVCCFANLNFFTVGIVECWAIFKVCDLKCSTFSMFDQSRQLLILDTFKIKFIVCTFETWKKIGDDFKIVQ